jgi:hypothetical protein
MHITSPLIFLETFSANCVLTQGLRSSFISFLCEVHRHLPFLKHSVQIVAVHRCTGSAQLCKQGLLFCYT